MFHGTHYIGDEILAHFQEGEEWRKTFGPFFVYLNSTNNVSNAYNLWEDAKKQRLLEEAAWPYEFVSSSYYLTAKGLGSATGRLYVQDRFISGSLIPAKRAYVGLLAARTAGAWHTESKDYQLWVQTDSNGYFTIKNVIPGVYGLHGWVPGFIGSETQLGNLTYVPRRDGPTVWEIGFPDRTALGYYVPDVNPALSTNCLSIVQRSSGNMACGTDTRICILYQIKRSQSESTIQKRNGSLLT
ncbi:probable rhamnogalacturonate lyase B [Manihot esculenta]|uniref:probable rhamnogalacturonate lyase B n=1 Tax=Manihot esculenta TaxID=3983 RepID=UPI000B5D4105|nr:probable rhamnogalacturonate lyase B [Manihot esculenta]XP_021597860.1 probable rhamnogalacturonate lyase B [Manihot esculenta]XP_043808040.1 probable rhamnogalacturonate lyase B [Manihot esculenta]XP_043808041.1 probable rhamnogalacturonate lyase B [Manihot esculenta]